MSHKQSILWETAEVYRSATCPGSRVTLLFEEALLAEHVNQHRYHQPYREECRESRAHIKSRSRSLELKPNAEALTEMPELGHQKPLVC